MTNPDAESDTPYLAPGTPVRLGDEEGYVVHCWMSFEIGAYDCYVALFEGPLPDRNTDARPTVWRYASTSLTVLSET